MQAVNSCMLNAVNVKPQLSYCAFEFSVSKHLCKASYLTLPFSAPLQLYTTWHVCSFAVVERAEAAEYTHAHTYKIHKACQDVFMYAGSAFIRSTHTNKLTLQNVFVWIA